MLDFLTKMLYIRHTLGIGNEETGLVRPNKFLKK